VTPAVGEVPSGHARRSPGLQHQAVKRPGTVATTQPPVALGLTKKYGDAGSLGRTCSRYSPSTPAKRWGMGTTRGLRPLPTREIRLASRSTSLMDRLTSSLRRRPAARPQANRPFPKRLRGWSLVP
jgi:hypothetical protein